MNIFDVLTMIGGLCLFLFGMNIMGQALERRAGSGLRSLLGKLTTSKLAGFVTGLERISDHCSNVAVCMIDVTAKNMNQHAMLKTVRASGGEFDQEYQTYSMKYHV